MPLYRAPAYVLLTSVLAPHSDEAAYSYNLFIYFFIAAGCMLLLVSVLTIAFLYKYRQRTNSGMPPQIKGNKTAETAMIAIPLLMVVFFFVLTVKTMSKTLPGDEGVKPDVVITAHQWWWQVDYPKAGVSTANEIHLPVGKKILLHFRSADVIHSWWVPEMGNKMDIVPGRENHLWLTIRDAGHYAGSCSEFCGNQHAKMHIQLYADSAARYSQWLSAQRADAVPPRDELCRKGAIIFQSETCGSCHIVRGMNRGSTNGPELTHVASRHTLLTGVMDNGAGNLEKWLNDPQIIKPGAYMPEFSLDSFSRKALVAYLMQLK